ncbi:hypothetical protein Trydic_g12370 [Trypoxylus dichotomus]
MSKFIVLVSFLAACVTALPTLSLIGRGSDRISNFRIFGGTDAADGAYPFMVSLRTLYNNHLTHFCGGTILNRRWILTAAQCMLRSNSSGVIAVIGTNTLDSGGIFRDVCKVVIHPNYNDTGYSSNDIAMAMVTIPFKYSSSIAPVVINGGFPRSILDVTVVGWGTIGKEHVLSNKLQELSTQTISWSLCSLYYIDMVTPKQICTRYRNGKGFCDGDSGSPLLQTDIRVQLGIASFNNAQGCGIALPDVFLKVAPESNETNPSSIGLSVFQILNLSRFSSIGPLAHPSTASPCVVVSPGPEYSNRFRSVLG